MTDDRIELSDGRIWLQPADGGGINVGRKGSESPATWLPEWLGDSLIAEAQARAAAEQNWRDARDACLRAEQHAETAEKRADVTTRWSRRWKGLARRVLKLWVAETKRADGAESNALVLTKGIEWWTARLEGWSRRCRMLERQQSQQAEVYSQMRDRAEAAEQRAQEAEDNRLHWISKTQEALDLERTKRQEAERKQAIDQAQCDRVTSEAAEMAAQLAVLVEALEFYADPDTYFAIGFFPDPPCGGFVDDFAKVENDAGAFEPRPGKRARAVLVALPAAAAVLREVVEAARELRLWGEEFDDERLNHITVQIERSDVERFDAALAALDKEQSA